MAENRKHKVDILLATYNGANFIADQIESIFNQDFDDWRLLVHDDGSNDQTVSIVKSFQNRDEKRVFLFDDGVSTGGAKQNFSYLMQLSEAPYVMFCDQDDIWLTDKISKSLKVISEIEKGFCTLPVVVYTDLAVVDENLQLISNSMWLYQRFNKIEPTLPNLSVSNQVTGCTMIINRAALVATTPIPEVAVMHDWWIVCQVLKKGGVLTRIPESLILYRQHASNEIGAQKISVKSYLMKLLNFKEAYRSFRYMSMQAKAINPEMNFLKIITIKVLHLIKRAYP